MDGMIKVETLEELQPTNDEVRCAVKVECEDIDSFHYQKIEPDVIIPEVKMEDDPLENVCEDVECVVKEEYKDVPCCYQSVEPDTIVPELNMDHDPLEDDCEERCPGISNVCDVQTKIIKESTPTSNKTKKQPRQTDEDAEEMLKNMRLIRREKMKRLRLKKELCKLKLMLLEQKCINAGILIE